MNPLYESIAFKRADTLDAIPQLVAHLQIHPLDVESWVALAASRYEAEQYHEAQTALNKAFRIRPDLPAAWLEKGRWLFQERRYEEAEAAMSQALALHPKNATIMTLRGMVRRKMGSFDEAKQDFSAAIALNPYQQDAQWQLRMFEEYEQAIEEDRWVTIATHFDTDWLFMIKNMLLEHQVPTQIFHPDLETSLHSTTDHSRKLQVRPEEAEQALWLIYDWAREFHFRSHPAFEREEDNESRPIGLPKRTLYLLLALLITLLILAILPVLLL